MYKAKKFVEWLFTWGVVIGTIATIVSGVALAVFALAMALGFSFN